ncbi:GNAT family N-acetyltransferase (plasmid) [Methylobacterium sp. NMS14P]|uniref:GNAT family N-acetyltransferase n=1 Tax=Methylobacterium sp. NMS14P TaxID=2894310 RepID=UPI002359E08A|nr:GNAT family N-acetyltransferase [Methylobacterium sp. NMS14P]WCS28583.1 GNAT family N-acetyltransferase [Methylobacterium sp. NMS14P]
MTSLREISSADVASILALNSAHVAELSLLDEQGLSELVAGSFHARRTGREEAFLIALDERHPTYASPNYLWFRRRYRRFVYVDRIVVAEHARGRGLARTLYEDLFRQASEAGHDLIVCEVNSVPPNAASDAFHARLGFAEVGAAVIHGGAKTVRYLALRLQAV